MTNANTMLKGRYALGQLLGKGGMGEVYLADDTSLGRQVAVKKVLYSGNDLLLKAAERETLVLARLQHDGLPRVLDSFNEDQAQYIVMEYIAGRDLAEVLRLRQSPFPVEQVLAWASPLLDILDYLHGQNPPVVHRDIKPANIKLTDGGRLFLLDFGLVKDTPTRVAGSNPSAASVYGYSQSYAPLEQINGDPTSVQTDIYGLCATLYHLLTNVKPADALDRATRAIRRAPDPLRPAHEVNPNVPPALSQALEEGLRLNCEDRVASAQALRQLLAQQGPRRHDRIRIDLNPEPAPGPVPAGGNAESNGPTPAPKPRDRRKLYAALAASLVVLALASYFGYRWFQQHAFQQLMAEQMREAEAAERNEGLLSQNACGKYAGVASDALDAGLARELVRKLNDCKSAQSLFAEAEKAEHDNGLNAQTVDAYLKIAQTYPGSVYERQAGKKAADFERVKQATLKAWKEMQEADHLRPNRSDDNENIMESLRQLIVRYELIGRENVDPDLASHLKSQIDAYNELKTALEKLKQAAADLDTRAAAKRSECSNNWFPDDCYNNWLRPERAKLEQSFITQTGPIFLKMEGLAQADKTVAEKLAKRYNAEFKDLG
jgi:serine/threonine protein kinase